MFGGGHVVLPLLEHAVVSPGWVTQPSFLAGYGFAQALPGPLFTFAAFLGAAIQSGSSRIALGIGRTDRDFPSRSCSPWWLRSPSGHESESLVPADRSPGHQCECPGSVGRSLSASRLQHCDSFRAGRAGRRRCSCLADDRQGAPMDGCVGGRSGFGCRHAVISGWNRSKHFQDGSVELQIPRLRSPDFL